MTAALPPPFVIVGTPRSRTAWLARFLTYGPWMCWHEPSVNFRCLGDLESTLCLPFTGMSDSMLTLLWGHIIEFQPTVRTVVVRRAISDVLGSLRELTPIDQTTVRLLEMIDAAAQRLSGQPGVLSVEFDDLDDADCCAAVMAHAIGEQMPMERFTRYQAKNIQAPLQRSVNLAAKNRAGIERVFGRYLTIARETI